MVRCLENVRQVMYQKQSHFKGFAILRQPGLPHLEQQLTLQPTHPLNVPPQLIRQHRSLTRPRPPIVLKAQPTILQSSLRGNHLVHQKQITRKVVNV